MTKELSSKKKHFVRIFKQEFQRELTFLWDVLSDRNTQRADFTDWIVDLVKQTVDRCPLPEIVSASLGLALDYCRVSRSHYCNRLTRQYYRNFFSILVGRNDKGVIPKLGRGNNPYRFSDRG